jgi:hypothetical protein
MPSDKSLSAASLASLKVRTMQNFTETLRYSIGGDRTDAVVHMASCAIIATALGAGRVIEVSVSKIAGQWSGEVVLSEGLTSLLDIAAMDIAGLVALMRCEPCFRFTSLQDRNDFQIATRVEGDGSPERVTMLQGKVIGFVASVLAANDHALASVIGALLEPENEDDPDKIGGKELAKLLTTVEHSYFLAA